MNTDIAAKETHYNGVTFRSRLEAKWASAFSGMFMEYAYEPKAYSLGKGLGYLPDFLLLNVEMYAEIKPNEDLSGEELEKIIKFGVDEEYPLILIVGLPTRAKMYHIQRRFMPPWEMFKARAGEDQSLKFFDMLRWNDAEVRFGKSPMSMYHAFVYADQPDTDTRIAGALQEAFNHDFSGRDQG